MAFSTTVTLTSRSDATWQVRVTQTGVKHIYVSFDANFIIFQDSSFVLYIVLLLMSPKWPINLPAYQLNKLMVAAGFIKKHKDKMICIKCIQLLLVISKSLIRVKCFHVLPLTYLFVKEIKWTGCGFKWNKESKEALGGLFHFSLDQVSKKVPRVGMFIS